MSGRELTISVEQEAPTQAGTANFQPGGSWTGNPTIPGRTVSFRAVARYGSGDETNVDLAGIERSTVSVWEGRIVADGDKLVFQVAIPSAAIHHLEFWYQDSPTFDPSQDATQCTVSILGLSEDLVLMTVLDDDNTAVTNFGAAPASIEANPVLDSLPTIRQNTELGSDGAGYAVSFAEEKLLDGIEYVLSQFSTFSQAEYKKMAQWTKKSVRLKVLESLTGGDVYIKSFIGYGDGIDYLLSRFKSRGEEWHLSFLVESETEEP